MKLLKWAYWSLHAEVNMLKLKQWSKVTEIEISKLWNCKHWTWIVEIDTLHNCFVQEPNLGQNNGCTSQAHCWKRVPSFCEIWNGKF